MRINDIKNTTKQKVKKIIGRGGKKGGSSGRGMKGQKSRSGGRKKAHLAGLRSSIIRRMPKLRGFKSLAPKLEVVNVEMLAKKFNDGETVTPQSLLAKGLIHNAARNIKILGEGELAKKLTVKNCLISASAKEKIEKAGGNIIAKIEVKK